MINYHQHRKGLDYHFITLPYIEVAFLFAVCTNRSAPATTQTRAYYILNTLTNNLQKVKAEVISTFT